MAKQTQTLEQKHKLTITGVMRQSISILQMSSTELLEFTSNALSQNPFIDEDNTTLEKTNTPKLKDNYTKAYATNYSSQDLLANIVSEKSLKEYIIEQVNIFINSPQEKIIALYLLDYLQGSGYLHLDINEAANRLKCSIELIEKVLTELQTFDPPGIFARDLKECLKIQIMEKGLNSDALIKLVNNLELLATGNYKKLLKICNTNIYNLKLLIQQVKSLNPKPGNGFLVEQTTYKIPDVILTFDEQGQAKLNINPNSIPKLRLSSEYYVKAKGSKITSDQKEFIRSEFEEASSMIKSIENRTSTIIKVAACIVQEQMDFFKYGVMHLKPMTLSKIAELTNFNESTINRSTANKYIATPIGIYELKYFFSSSLSNTKNAQTEISSTKVKELVKQMILDEGDETLSDEEIAVSLRSFNIDIARRTVAKYRDMLGISTSAVRKRSKKINLEITETA